jgi:hypothetical protein
MIKMRNEELIISIVVGYMLKLLKNKVNITSHLKEFAAIRHGNYDEFIQLVNGEKPFMVMYDNGEIRTDNFNQNNTCDFGMLIQSGPSLIKFYKEVKSIYGEVNDIDISDDIYKKLVLFEISLRVHANNNNLIGNKETIENVINKLSKFKNLSTGEIEKLHNGRLFTNYVKHKKSKKFSSYQDGINLFNEAYNVLINHQLTII